MQAISSVNMPAPPPCSCSATSGSSASSALACRKNRNTRTITARMRGDCRTCCRPTRIAPTKRSPGSALARGVDFQRRISTKAAPASSAFSTNTEAVPVDASSAPATVGPMTRDRFIEMPLSASADGSCARETTSGTMAENTGQRIARPMPFRKVSSSSSSAVSSPASASAAISSATSDTHNCVAAK